jgi:hypothetical protein
MRLGLSTQKQTLPKGNVMPRKFLNVVLATFVVVAFATVSEARDNGEYAHVSKDIKAWIERLTDRSGTSCCSTADGVQPLEVEWDIGAHHYRVKVDDQWLTVPDSAVVRGPNRLGHAVVWLYYELDLEQDVQDTYVRCFLPGPAS